MISERFKIEVLRHKARGGRLSQLAIEHGMTPSMLSASPSGARRADADERIVKLGAQLGLTSEECSQTEDSA